jgi:hypothetical protein
LFVLLDKLCEIVLQVFHWSLRVLANALHIFPADECPVVYYNTATQSELTDDLSNSSSECYPSVSTGVKGFPFLCGAKLRLLT